MSGFDDDEEWLDDLWWVDDIENLPDTLVSTAYGHSPAYAPESYDAYDSDIDEIYSDGDDDYYDGPPGSPSPVPPLLLPPSQPFSQPMLSLAFSTNSLNGILAHTTATSPTPLPTKVPEHLTIIERRYREAMVGKKFYGELEEGDAQYLPIRRPWRLGSDPVRKRRKVSHPSGTCRTTPPAVLAAMSAPQTSVSVVEIVGDTEAGTRAEIEDEEDGGSAEGYDSDREEKEVEGTSRRKRARSLVKEVEIRPVRGPSGGRKRKSIKPPPTRVMEVSEDTGNGMSRGKRQP